MKENTTIVITFVLGCIVGYAIWYGFGEQLGWLVFGAGVSFAVLMGLMWR